MRARESGKDEGSSKGVRENICKPQGQMCALTSLTEVRPIYSLHSENCDHPCCYEERVTRFQVGGNNRVLVELSLQGWHSYGSRIVVSQISARFMYIWCSE